MASGEDLVIWTSRSVIVGSWCWRVSQDIGEIAGEAKGVPEGNIIGSIKCCMDIIAFYTCCIFFTIRQSTSNALISYPLPTGCTYYTPDYSSDASRSHTSNTDQKPSSPYTQWYWWDEVNSALTRNHCMTDCNVAIGDNSYSPQHFFPCHQVHTKTPTLNV